MSPFFWHNAFGRSLNMNQIVNLPPLFFPFYTQSEFIIAKSNGMESRGEKATARSILKQEVCPQRQRVVADRSRTPQILCARDCTFSCISEWQTCRQREQKIQYQSYSGKLGQIQSLSCENGHGRETTRVTIKKENYKTLQISQEFYVSKLLVTVILRKRFGDSLIWTSKMGPKSPFGLVNNSLDSFLLTYR